MVSDIWDVMGRERGVDERQPQRDEHDHVTQHDDRMSFVVTLAGVGECPGGTLWGSRRG